MLFLHTFKTPSFLNRKSYGPETVRVCSLPTICHMSSVTCDVSGVTCHVSCVRCQVSGVRCHIYRYKFFFKEKEGITFFVITGDNFLQLGL